MANKQYGENDLTDAEKFIQPILESVRNDAGRTREMLDRFTKVYRTQFYPEGNLFSGDDVLLEEEGTSTETNYLFAHVDSLVASITPPNPKVTVKAHRRALKEAAKYRQALINRTFEKEQFASKLWKLAARATVWPRCFIKTVWNGKKKRPTLRIVNPHRVWFDVAAEDWDDIRWVLEITTLTKGQFKQRMKKRGKAIGDGEVYRHDALEDVSFNKLPTWLQPDTEDHIDELEKSVHDAYKYVVIFEFYDLVSNKFYHFADGCPKALFAGELPYKYVKNPYTPLIFNDNLTNLSGLSDAELVYPLLERKNELSSLKLHHVKATIPVMMYHRGLVDSAEELEASIEEGWMPGDTVPIDAIPGVALQNIFAQTPTPTLSPDWNAMAAELDGAIQQILGTADYQRGQLGGSDVATEFALAEGAKKTRDARRQKALYFAISSTAVNIINLFREYLAADYSIPISIDGGEEEKEVDRAALGFALEDAKGLDSDDPWTWDYEALPYNASEANDVVQLKRLEAFLPILMQFAQMGLLDQQKLAEKLAELLNMKEVVIDPSEAPAGMAGAPPGMAPSQMPGQPQGPEAMPAPTPGMPPGAEAPMSGGQVQVGVGAQNVTNQEMV